MNQCPLCKARELLRKANDLIDQVPEIHSDLYDDAIADLSNQVSNTISLFQCMCDEETTEAQS
jgi:hypothetical protein